MHSTASTLVMKLLRTTVYCKSLYTPQDGITYLNISTPPTTQVNTNFYLSGATSAAATSSSFSGCGVSLYGGVFWLAAGTPFTDVNSIYQGNSGAHGGVFNVQASTLKMTGSTLTANQAWRGGVIDLRDSSYFKGNSLTITSNLAFYSAGAINV